MRYTHRRKARQQLLLRSPRELGGPRSAEPVITMGGLLGSSAPLLVCLNLKGGSVVDPLYKYDRSTEFDLESQILLEAPGDLKIRVDLMQQTAWLQVAVPSLSAAS